MNQCVRDILDERISNDDVGFVVNSIPYSVQVIVNQKQGKSFFTEMQFEMADGSKSNTND